MSYILEALKKAQAERQLGNAPTLNAVPVGAAPPDAAAARRLPAWIAVAALALTGALAALAWRMQTHDARPAVPAAVVVTTPVAPPVALPVAAPVTPAPAASASVPAPPLAVVPASTPAARPPKPSPAPVKAAPPAPPTVAEEERLPSLRELPEAIQHAVPPLAFGGYMYSANPADRLLLIDKALRHEGEEVAPGLVLEKLLPKAAVMNYKGYRYRVPY
ncbi:MAG: general secretion pathway protein GspB [Pseudomonadota bacterium]|nr:general secretion pathway protein GspB [Pseudomonadota bacterium]